MVFLGNVSTGLYWHVWAARTRDPALLAHTMAGIIRSDRLFTIPGVIAIIVSGTLAAVIANLPILRTPWIVWTLVLFSISGLAFMFKVAPLQRQMHALARGEPNAPAFDYTQYRALAIRWDVWGAVALLTPIAGMVLMVLKPNV